VAEKLINAACWPDYNLSDGVLKYKNIIVIENNDDLRNILVGAAMIPTQEDMQGFRSTLIKG
jgi:hypothetical protein